MFIASLITTKAEHFVSMADNFLERHREDYEQRKAAWLKKKKNLKVTKKISTINRPDDEAL